jgi:hypothetical protein
MANHLEVVLKNDYVSRWKYRLERLRLFFDSGSAVDSAAVPKEKVTAGDCNEKTEKMDWKEKFGNKWFY